MKILSITTALCISLSTFIVHASDSRDELPTQKSKAVKAESKQPETILIKKDQNGKITVYQSNDVMGPVNPENASELEKLNFKEAPANLNLASVKEFPVGVQELDSDKPRQSWYYWGWGFTSYFYYYPTYYYTQVYYPYYYYNWGGCSYYWYGYRW